MKKTGSVMGRFFFNGDFNTLLYSISLVYLLSPIANYEKNKATYYSLNACHYWW